MIFENIEEFLHDKVQLSKPYKFQYVLDRDLDDEALTIREYNATSIPASDAMRRYFQIELRGKDTRSTMEDIWRIYNAMQACEDAWRDEDFWMQLGVVTTPRFLKQDNKSRSYFVISFFTITNFKEV